MIGAPADRASVESPEMGYLPRSAVFFIRYVGGPTHGHQSADLRTEGDDQHQQRGQRHGHGRARGASGPGRFEPGGMGAMPGRKSIGRISCPIEGYTPRRRGDSARRVQWPEQGEAEVRTPLPQTVGGVHFPANSRKSPPSRALRATRHSGDSSRTVMAVGCSLIPLDAVGSQRTDAR
jgi:hypothetical protein